MAASALSASRLGYARPFRAPGSRPVGMVGSSARLRILMLRVVCAQQRRSNSALCSRTNHHAPVLLLWCNGLLREGSWWVPWRGSLDGMQGEAWSDPTSLVMDRGMRSTMS
jgi:hypothetical protein